MFRHDGFRSAQEEEQVNEKEKIIMTEVLLSPLRNTTILAKEAATIDNISKGRLTLGLGVGTREDDFIATNTPYFSDCSLSPANGGAWFRKGHQHHDNGCARWGADDVALWLNESGLDAVDQVLGRRVWAERSQCQRDLTGSDADTWNRGHGGRN